ncbi:arginase family enzyme [Rhizobium sp. SORGH_AS 787]|nr:arginase family enzyme [Rhizobium sp. SORGH_AS_0787]
MEADAIIEKEREVVGDGAPYLPFDVDSLDPASAPGTGTPAVGRLTSRQASDILHGPRGLSFVGDDVVEVALQHDSTTITAYTGAQMLFEILSLIRISPAVAPPADKRPVATGI